MHRQVYVDFQTGDGFEDISHLVKYDTLNITTRAFSDNYHYAQNEASFSVIYDAVYYPKFRYNAEDILVRILDVYDESLILAENNWFLLTEDSFYLGQETGGYVPIFYGRVPPTKSRVYNGILDNILFQVEAVDDTMQLDVSVGDICYRNYRIMDPSNTSQSIVHQLAYLAGLTDAQIDQTVSIGATLLAFSPPSEEDKIVDLLDTLLFEYQYVLNFNTSGQLSPICWFPGGATVHTFDDTNIIREVQIDNELKQYDGVETTYYELGYGQSSLDEGDILVYRDRELPIDDKGQFSGYSVPAGYTYPVKTNTIDEITGLPQVVYQDYDDTGIRYWTNKAIVNRLDYNYKAFDSDYSDIVATFDHRVEWYGDTGIVVSGTPVFNNKKARIVFSNPTGGILKLYYFLIYANLIYKTAERKSIVNNIAVPKTIDKYSSTFIFEKGYADMFTTALAGLYAIDQNTYTFDSADDISVGAYVRTTLGDGTDQNCIVMQKQFDETTQLYSYILKAHTQDIGTLTRQTYIEAPRIKPTTYIKAALDNPSIAITARIDGTLPDLTEATPRMTVIKDDTDDSMAWSYSVVLDGLVGTLGTGADKNKLTITAFTTDAIVTGTATITASKSGYNDQVQTYIVKKVNQTDALNQASVDGRVYTVTPRYLGRYLYASKPTSANEGDTTTLYSTTAGERGIYAWVTSAWVKQTTPTTEMIANAWADICWIVNQVVDYGETTAYTGSGVNFIDVLGANVAFMNSLFAQYIKVQTGGSIRGGDRFSSTGTVLDSTKSGFYIGADGDCRVAGLRFEGEQGGGVQWINMASLNETKVLTGIYNASIASLGQDSFALMDETSRNLYKYTYQQGAGWAKLLSGTGVGLACGTTSISALSKTRIAFIDSTNKSLRAYTHDGTVWNLTGSGLTITMSTIAHLAALSSTTIAFAENTTLKTYGFNGSIWAQVGNTLDISAYAYPQGIAALAATRVVLITYDGSNTYLPMFEFDGTDWTQVGGYPTLEDSTSPISITAINATDFIFASTTNSDLRIFSYNGTDVVQLGRPLHIATDVPARIAAMNGSDILGVSSEYLSTYRAAYTLSRPYSNKLTD